MNINTGFSESKLIKVFFLFFLFVFLSHYTYQNLDMIFDDVNQELIANLGDFDSEEENNENEKEFEDLDDYLFLDPLLTFNKFTSTLKVTRPVNIRLSPFIEIDSPPPIL